MSVQAENASPNTSLCKCGSHLEPSLKGRDASLVGQQVIRTGWLKNLVEQVLS